MSKTLFERIGGQDAVKAAVDIFYKKNLLDTRVQRFFMEIDINHLKSHQVLFLTYVFGGIPHYNGRSLWDAHKHLVEKFGLNDDHFDAIAENLAETLNDLNVAQDIIEDVLEILGGAREQVLRGGAA